MIAPLQYASRGDYYIRVLRSLQPITDELKAFFARADADPQLWDALKAAYMLGGAEGAHVFWKSHVP